MKIKINLAIAVVLLFTACEDKEKIALQLQNKVLIANKDSIGKLYQEKENFVNELTGMVSDIQSGLNEISKTTGKMQKVNDKANDEKSILQLKKDSINFSMGQIKQFMEEQKNKMAQVRNKLNSSNVKIGNLETLIKNLEESIVKKDEEIEYLKTELAKKDSALITAYQQIQKNTEEIGSKTTKVETMFYVINTSDELEKMNIIEYKGGFLGLNSKPRLKEKLDRTLFTKINMYKSTVISIPVKADDIVLISNRPEDSYELKTEGEKTILTIKDADAFWETSRYLAIKID